MYVYAVCLHAYYAICMCHMFVYICLFILIFEIKVDVLCNRAPTLLVEPNKCVKSRVGLDPITPDYNTNALSIAPPVIHRNQVT